MDHYVQYYNIVRRILAFYAPRRRRLFKTHLPPNPLENSCFWTHAMKGRGEISAKGLFYSNPHSSANGSVNTLYLGRGIPGWWREVDRGRWIIMSGRSGTVNLWQRAVVSFGRPTRKWLIIRGRVVCADLNIFSRLVGFTLSFWPLEIFA